MFIPSMNLVYYDAIKYRYNDLYKFFLLLQSSPLLYSRSKNRRKKESFDMYTYIFL